MIELTAIVAAGGFASRMGIYQPKPMLSIEGKTLLEYTLNSLQLASVRKILVFNNREEFQLDYLSIIKKYDNVELVRCNELNSTVKLLYITREISPSMNYLFCYGNAPRTQMVCRDIIHGSNHLGAINLKQSSRKDLISNGNYFLEPPFFINESTIRPFPEVVLWSDLFFKFKKYTFHYYIDAPSEFNTQAEWHSYKRYIYDYLVETPIPNNSIDMTRQHARFLGVLPNVVLDRTFCSQLARRASYLGR